MHARANLTPHTGRVLCSCERAPEVKPLQLRHVVQSFDQRHAAVFAQVIVTNAQNRRDREGGNLHMRSSTRRSPANEEPYGRVTRA